MDKKRKPWERGEGGGGVGRWGVGADRQTETETDRQTDRQTELERQRQTEREAERTKTGNERVVQTAWHLSLKVRQPCSITLCSKIKINDYHIIWGIWRLHVDSHRVRGGGLGLFRLGSGLNSSDEVGLEHWGQTGQEIRNSASLNMNQQKSISAREVAEGWMKVEDTGLVQVIKEILTHSGWLTR